MYTVGISTHICCIMKWKQTQVNMQYMGGMDILLQHNKIIWINMSMTTFKGILEQSFSQAWFKIGMPNGPFNDLICFANRIISYQSKLLTHFGGSIMLTRTMSLKFYLHVCQMSFFVEPSIFFCLVHRKIKESTCFESWKIHPFFSSTWLVGPIYEKMNKNRTSQMEDFYCLNDFMCQRNHVLEGSVMSL